MPDDASRPSPEHFLQLIRQAQRGRLKVYLGFAAGVGKTYEMLQEAHRLRKLGLDVAVGVVETHGRPETAQLLEGLEQIPRRHIEYHGVSLEEMDLDTVLRRHPTLVLVDELAHTNAPGCRHNKRYQDVEELLHAGINVITTLNVQHMESLYDLVEKATGVKVKERVPDYVLAMADQIVNVDLSAEDLQERLVAGKVYPSERIKAALENFFTSEKLTRLRELTLGEIAHLLDRHRRGPAGQEKSAGDRLMVCISSGSPNSEALLRKGARLAERLNAAWYAVYIQTPSEEVERVGAEVHRRVSNTLALAHQLGAFPIPYKGRDVVTTIATFVKEYGITQILLGRTQKSWWQRWFKPPILDQLLAATHNVDVIIVDTT